MRRKIRQAQNINKAVEVRLEGEIGEYYLIVAGMTINFRPIPIHEPEPSRLSDEYYLVENELYKVDTYYNYNQAMKAFERAKEKYVGG